MPLEEVCLPHQVVAEEWGAPPSQQGVGQPQQGVGQPQQGVGSPHHQYYHKPVFTGSKYI